LFSFSTFDSSGLICQIISDLSLDPEITMGVSLVVFPDGIPAAMQVT